MSAGPCAKAKWDKKRKRISREYQTVNICVKSFDCVPQSGTAAMTKQQMQREEMSGDTPEPGAPRGVRACARGSPCSSRGEPRTGRRCSSREPAEQEEHVCQSQEEKTSPASYVPTQEIHMRTRRQIVSGYGRSGRAGSLDNEPTTRLLGLGLVDVLHKDALVLEDVTLDLIESRMCTAHTSLIRKVPDHQRARTDIVPRIQNQRAPSCTSHGRGACRSSSSRGT